MMRTDIMKVCAEYEKKLIELMGPQKFGEYSAMLARRMFAAELEEMEDGEFKEFALKNFNKITGGEKNA